MGYDQKNILESEAKRLVDDAKAFIVELSTKRHIKCDREEIQRVVEGISSGSIVKLKQGFINPSWFVDIVEDEERLQAFKEKIHSVLRHNIHDRDYNDGKNQIPFDVFKPLKDIFHDVPLKQSIGSSGAKKLN